MRKIGRLVKQHFLEFSTTEANGFVVLIFITSCLLFSPSILRLFPKIASSPEELEQDKKITEQIIKNIQEAEKQAKSKPHRHEYKGKLQSNQFGFKPFPFNPNVIKVQDWIRLGLKNYLAKRIEKYKSKGGYFKYKSDLRKIYGFPDWLYTKLEPYILLPEKKDNGNHQLTVKNASPHKKYDDSTTNSQQKTPHFTKKPTIIQPFDINTADTTTLRQISGIGAVLSERIIKFRNRLGGFYALHQIKEVYGLPPKVQNELLKYARLQKPNYVRIHINSATLNELKKHPYIRYPLAKVLINYRLQHGRYADAEDLRKIKIMDAEILEKLKPYLSFE